jgi:hypothetical protein
MGANVGINILSPSSRSRLFLIMWGFELYLKFGQGGGHIEKPKKKKPLSENESEGSLLQELGETETETETTPNNESETGKKSGVNTKLKLKAKTETFEH